MVSTPKVKMRNIRNVLLRTALPVVLGTLTFILIACERSIKSQLSKSNPPTFRLSGSGQLVFFSVFEVQQGRSPSVDDPKLWEIQPTEDKTISDLPEVTFGVVPQGFRQTIPAAGAPPQLVEGTLYQAGGPAYNANGGSIRFKINGGKVQVEP